MSNLWVYDIEQFENFHSFTAINVETDEEKCFVLWYDSLSDEVIDDSEQYFAFLRGLQRMDNSGLIGYNNLAYDYSMVHELMKNEHARFKGVSVLVELLYKKNNDLINDSPGVKPMFRGVPERYHFIPQLDLFKIHHFDNAARSTSLKRLAINMRWKDIRDLPIPPGSVVKKEQIEEILTYNRNDVLITKEFYWITKGDKSRITVDFPGLSTYYLDKDRIAQRKEIGKEYNINCMNYSDVKIGEEINKSVYLLRTGKKWDDIKNEKTHRMTIELGSLIPSYIVYKSKVLNDLLKLLRETTITIGDEKFKHEFIFADNLWTFGLGGIHTQDKGRITIPSANEWFEEQDVGLIYWLN